MKSPAYEIHCRYSLSAKASAAHVPMRSVLLELDFLCGVAFRYHDYIITSWRFPHEEKYSSAIYQYDDTNPDDHSDGRDATLVYIYDDEFDDQGDAVKTALERAICIHSERLMKREVK